MKAIILAAGFGTRLQQDLDIAGPNFYHLKNLPKPLLPIANKALIEYLIDELSNITQISQTYIITNQLYYNQFKSWAQSYGFSQDNIIQNKSVSNETRLGAISDLQFAIKSKNIDDDLLIVAGDTLFPEQVKLQNLVDHFYQINTNLVSNYVVNDEDLGKRGIIELDQNNKIIKMLEKPLPHQTNSRNACPPLYFYTKDTVKKIPEFLKITESMPLNQRDAPGNLLAWLYDKTIIHSKEISGRYDVGNLAQYVEVNRVFSNK
jgi:glucose-1-phosphate thymidylyltransferase